MRNTEESLFAVSPYSREKERQIGSAEMMCPLRNMKLSKHRFLDSEYLYTVGIERLQQLYPGMMLFSLLDCIAIHIAFPMRDSSWQGKDRDNRT